MKISQGMTRTADLLRGPIEQQIGGLDDGLEKLAFHLVGAVAAFKLARRHALKEAGELIKKDAEAQIGEYQESVGIYPEWAPLAESTEDQKARAGAPPDAPLESASGDLKVSFRVEIESDDTALVGSTDPAMEYHEFGTSKMPPRPALGPAYVKQMENIHKVVGETGVAAILVGQRLGYLLEEIE